MIKKTLVFLLIFLNGIAYAQKSVGFFNVGVSLFTPWSDESSAAIFPAITVIPGLWLMQDKKVSLSLNLPVSLGGTFESDTYFGIDAPVMLSVGFGSATGVNHTSKFGFILAAGAAYTNVVNFYDSGPSEKLHTEFFGYRLNAGVSFKGDKENNFIPALVISFGKPFARTNAHIIGLGIHVIFGD